MARKLQCGKCSRRQKKSYYAISGLDGVLDGVLDVLVLVCGRAKETKWGNLADASLLAASFSSSAQLFFAPREDAAKEIALCSYGLY